MTTEASTATTAATAPGPAPAAPLPPLSITRDQITSCVSILAAHTFDDVIGVVRDLAALDNSGSFSHLQRAFALAYISVYGEPIKSRSHAAFVLLPFLTQPRPSRTVPFIQELTLDDLTTLRGYVMTGLNECVAVLSTDWPYYPYADMISILASYRNEPWPAVVPYMMTFLQSERDTLPRVGCYLLNKIYTARSTRRDLRTILPLIVARLNALLQPASAQPPASPPTTAEVGAMTNRVAAAITHLVLWTASGDDDTEDLKDITSVFPLILAAQWSGAMMTTTMEPGATVTTTLALFVQRLTKMIEMMVNDRYEDIPPQMIEPIWLAQCKLSLPPAIPNEIRVAAINVIVTISERVPKAIRRSSALINAGIRSCLMMMTHHTMTDDEWANDTSESDGYVTVTAEKKKIAAAAGATGEKKDTDGKSDGKGDAKTDEPQNKEAIANEGSGALDRICNSLGNGRAGQAFMNIALPIFNELANQGSWQYRAAAIRAFGQLAEYIPFRQLPVTQIVSYLTDAHPRVRYNAIRALSQMAHDHTPQLQNKYHASILPALVAGMDDSLPRLQGFNSWAIGTFLSELKGEERLPKPKPAEGEEEKKKEDGDDSDDDYDSGPEDDAGDGDDGDEDSKPRKRRPVIPVVQYYEVIMTKLLAILKSAPNHIKEDVFPCFTSLCHAAPRAFSKYYDTIVPILKALVVHANTPELSVVRSYAIETVTLIGMKNREKFKSDAIEVMGPLLELLRSGHVTATDKAHPYILRASGRICRVVGKEFAPVLPLLMPSVMQVLKRQLTPRQTQMIMSSRDSGLNHRAVMDAPEFKEGLSSMDDKVDAIEFIEYIVRHVGDAYVPYLVDTAAALVPLLNMDSMSDDVENATMECVPKLIICGVKSFTNGKIEKRLVLDAYMMTVEALLTLMTPESANINPNNANPDEPEDEFDNVNGRAMQCLATMIDAGGEVCTQIWNEGAIGNVATRITTVVRAMVNRIRLRAQIADDIQNGGDNDEDAEGELEKLQNEDEDALIDVLELMTQMLKTFGGERCLPAWNILRDMILMLMNHPYNEFDTLKRTGVDLYCESIQHLPPMTPSVMSTLTTAVPILLQCLPNPDFRQTCAFGLGICAKQCGTAMTPFVDATMTALVTMINQPDSRDEENSDATDNAISSIAHIALHQNRSELLPLWLSYLPLTSETTESEVCYTILCDQIEANNGALLGVNFANLPRILSVICDILHVSHTKMCTPTIRGRLVAIVARLATLPPEAVAALNASLNDTQRATFAAVIAKSQADAAAVAAAAAAFAALAVNDTTTTSSSSAPPPS